MTPEHFLPEIEDDMDPAELGKGCLVSETEDGPE